ncbi:hypothetical protein GCM10011369_05680 [Neiella marina]|uniref:Uncharacterized protein n=1 Tax=Neiella marina TaxID=508461 RepID=A0A8J2U2I6_9GAMM|nr:hypothetical protein [Neiella marina]GGA66922.1 hypothetical protein GCM10011369_05680 [Neiella marina]
MAVRKREQLRRTKNSSARGRLTPINAKKKGISKIVSDAVPSETASDKQQLMARSKDLYDGASSIVFEMEELWANTERYMDETEIFDPEVWETIREAVFAGKVSLEKIIAKAVKDNLPKKYGMGQGEFFGKLWGLKAHQVSKIVRRSKVRNELEPHYADIECIKDSLLDKIAKLRRDGVPMDMLLKELEELYWEDGLGKFPTVAKFESRVKGALSEKNTLAELTKKELKSYDEYDINNIEDEASDVVETASSNTNSSEASLGMVLQQLKHITKQLDSLNTAILDEPK